MLRLFFTPFCSVVVVVVQIVSHNKLTTKVGNAFFGRAGRGLHIKLFMSYFLLML